jgi:hypothetical protein
MSADQRAVLVSDTIETEDWFSPPQIDDSNKRLACSRRGQARLLNTGAPLWVAPPLVSTVVGVWSLFHTCSYPVMMASPMDTVQLE